MKPAIYFEAREFLEATGMSAAALCREAGIPSVTLSRILNGERQDMVSANADKLRRAMWNLGRQKRERGASDEQSA